VHVHLAYGRSGLTVDLPESAELLHTRFTPGLPDEAQTLRQALRRPIESPPLADLVRPGDKVVVVHTDITRATPNERILPILLDELELAGVRQADITLLNGLGTHRRQTEVELRAMLGERIVDQYRCLQHDCFDDSNLVSLGVTALGHPVRVNRIYLEADVRILTGFIEPHFFAGFSGGPKAILPSLAGAESVFTNHGLPMIAHPKAAWGITLGNPIWEEMHEVALRTNPTFLLNVALNSRKEITAVFAGDMLAAHSEGCAFVKEHAMVGVEAPYDVVITTNSGYPLDQNLYQSVKGMSAAAQVVNQGGAIIIATACEDGMPDHGLYADLLAQAGSVQGIIDLISQPSFKAQDQWQVQIQAQIQQKADVYVYSDGLSDAQIEKALFIPCRSIEETVAALLERYGPLARICVMPEGPQVIPYLRDHGQIV
jgi:nickel-dependent lactate racemase